MVPARLLSNTLSCRPPSALSDSGSVPVSAFRLTSRKNDVVEYQPMLLVVV